MCMLLKLLLLGQTNTGKTHLAVEMAKEINAKLIDVDDKALEPMQKLDAEDSVERLYGNPWNDFISSLKRANQSDADMVIIDSVTELSEVIKQFIKQEIIKEGEFHAGGVHREKGQSINPNTMLLTWEMHPTVYSKIRGVRESLKSNRKSFILTYHPPPDKASKGEINMLRGLKRVSKIVAKVGKDVVNIESDLFLNKEGEMSREDFINYCKSIIHASNIKEIKP